MIDVPQGLIFLFKLKLSVYEVVEHAITKTQ